MLPRPVFSLLDRDPVRSMGSISNSTWTTALDAGPFGESAALNAPSMCRLSGQRVGDEPDDPPLAGGGRQVLERSGADHPTLTTSPKTARPAPSTTGPLMRAV